MQFGSCAADALGKRAVFCRALYCNLMHEGGRMRPPFSHRHRPGITVLPSSFSRDYLGSWTIAIICERRAETNTSWHGLHGLSVGIRFCQSLHQDIPIPYPHRTTTYPLCPYGTGTLFAWGPATLMFNRRFVLRMSLGRYSP